MTVKATLLALVVTCAGCFDSNTDNKQPSNSAGEPANSSLSSPSASESISQSAAAKPKTAAELAKLKQDFAKTPSMLCILPSLAINRRLPLRLP